MRCCSRIISCWPDRKDHPHGHWIPVLHHLPHRGEAEVMQGCLLPTAQGQTRQKTDPPPLFLANLKCSIEANLSTPLTKLAKSQKESRMMIAIAVKDDLRMWSYVRRLRSLLTDHPRDVRCPQLLSHLQHNLSIVRVFVEEKKFVVDEVSNRQNDRVLAFDPSKVPPVLQSTKSNPSDGVRVCC